MLKNLTNTKHFKQKVGLLVFAITFSIGVSFILFLNQYEFYNIDSNMVKPISPKLKDFKKSKCDFNPLILEIFVNENKEIKYYGESMGNLENLSKLEISLKKKFQEREDFGVYRYGTNEAIKEVIIVPQFQSGEIDLNDLIETLDYLGANPILIDWNHYSEDVSGGSHGGKNPCSFFDRQELKYEETNFTK
jgi:hypothetical protein